MDRSNTKTVDKMMEILTEVHIGTEGASLNYPSNNQNINPNLYDLHENQSGVNYYSENMSLGDNEIALGDQLDAKTDDPNASKCWREGMEMKTGEDATAKTVFLSQNLNKGYEEQEQQLKLTSYKSGVAKIVRETDYFSTILQRVGDDLKVAECRTSRDNVLGQRETVKTKLSDLKNAIDTFVSKNLSGEPEKQLDPNHPLLKKKISRKDVAEYAFIGEKKPPGSSERCISLNMCADCNIEIIAEDDQDLESAMVQHSQTELHRASMPEPPPPRKSKVEALAAQIPMPVNTDGHDRKIVENLKKSPILRLNKIISSAIDDSISCEVCEVGFPSNLQDIFKHINETSHRDKLNSFNLETQKTIIENNSDMFGESGQFQLTSIHTNLHKIFVDPSIKQAYCGLCCRQLPFSQSNIDEHVSSFKHDKLLIEAVESNINEFISLGIDNATLTSIKARSTTNCDTAPKEIKLKPKEPQVMPQPQPIPQQQQQAKDVFLDVADIQNFRKVLPDKPLKSIPEIFDSNNLPIQNLEYYEQPELKKFLTDNGLLRQPGGKFKCQFCPNLEIPNSRYAFRHISKHKVGSGNSQCFENWKRHPNRQQGYMNEQKLGRVVMHKNGVNYWCTSCRLPLIDASTAFAHVKTDNHLMYVDGVSFSAGTIFDCSTCKTTINGEKNACQHLIAVKHKENSKIEALAKQEGRMNMLEERKQKQLEKQKANEAQRKEKASTEYSQNSVSDEERLLDKNGVVYSSDSGVYHCGYCGWNNKRRSDMITHIFSYEHMTCMSKQGR